MAIIETLNWLGESYRENGEPEKAIRAYEQALQYQSTLASTSTVDSFRNADKARLLYNRALARRDLNQKEEAEKDLRQSMDLLQQSLSVRRTEPAFLQGLARSRINLGILLRGMNREKDANQEYLAAIELLHELERRFPRNADYRLELATVWMNRGNLLVSDQARQLGLEKPLEVAEASYRSSVDMLRNLVSEYSNVPRYRKELANSLNGLGAVLSQAGANEQAEQTWVDCANVLKELIARSPKVAEYHNQLALTTRNLAYLHRDDSEMTELVALLRETVERQRNAVSLSPTNVLYAQALGNYERSFARTLVGGGNHAEAAEVARQLAGRSTRDAKNLYAAASVFAQCAVVAEKDSTLNEVARSKTMQRYREEATQLINACQQLGQVIRPEDFPGMPTRNPSP
jgi:tetratricopeptide (TPR) repeat protein